MYELREYNVNDKEQITKLWVDVCVKEHGFEAWAEEIGVLNEEEYEKILVAVYDNKVIGTMAYKKINEEEVELKRVYIYPEHRGNGLAKKLLDTMVVIIKENKYKRIFIETWEDFKSGRRFYEKNNFVIKNIQGQIYNYTLEL